MHFFEGGGIEPLKSRYSLIEISTHPKLCETMEEYFCENSEIIVFLKILIFWQKLNFENFFSGPKKALFEKPKIQNHACARA